MIKEKKYAGPLTYTITKHRQNFFTL